MPQASESKRVLIVEDDEDSAELLAETFQLHGHRVHVAHDGASALAAAEEFQPEVALLDLGLPDMDGCELAEQLRARPDFTRGLLRLVALTGYGGPDAEEKLQKVGFDEWLLKPAQPEDLLRAVSKRAGTQA